MMLNAQTAPDPVRGPPALPSAVASDLPRRPAAAHRRVLVVDDELDIRETLELLLAQAGYQVTLADSGLAAVAAVRAARFDLVITDLRMPGMSGAETLTAIKQLDPALPVIVATGYPSDETAADCRRRGAAEFLKKPFEIDELLRLLARLAG